MKLWGASAGPARAQQGGEGGATEAGEDRPSREGGWTDIAQHVHSPSELAGPVAPYRRQASCPEHGTIRGLGFFLSCGLDHALRVTMMIAIVAPTTAHA